MKQANLVFVLNEETKRNAADHAAVPEENIIVLPNGVNTKVYCPLPEAQRLAAKEAYDLAGKQVILQVGSINENKGQLRSVQMLEPLLQSCPELVFAYAGGIVEQDYHNSISEYARQKSLEQQVRYLGMVEPGEALNSLYNCADATIMASKFEGFSLVTIEACAAGVPVLLEKNGPCHIDAGSVLYSPEDGAQQAAQLLQNPTFAARLRAEARSGAEEIYSWDQIAARYAAHFETAL